MSTRGVVFISLIVWRKTQHAPISFYMRIELYNRRFLLRGMVTISRFQHPAPNERDYQGNWYLRDFRRANYIHFRTGGREIEQRFKHLVKPSRANLRRPRRAIARRLIPRKTSIVTNRLPGYQFRTISPILAPMGSFLCLTKHTHMVGCRPSWME